MLSRELKLLAQLITASAGHTWTKESAAAIHDTLVLMAVSAERLEAGASPVPEAFRVPDNATVYELAQAVIRNDGRCLTQAHALGLAHAIVNIHQDADVSVRTRGELQVRP